MTKELSNRKYPAIYHDGSWNDDELRRLARGEKVDRNGKRYAVCDECRNVVCVDKRLFGSIHLCE